MLCRDSMLVRRVVDIFRSEILSSLSQATFCNQLKCCEISPVTMSQGDRDVFDSFRNSCLFSRHSRSNHFLLDVVLIRLRDFLVLILTQIFDVSVRMFRASSSETLTSSMFRFIYSLIRI